MQTKLSSNFFKRQNLEDDTGRLEWDFHLFGSSYLPVQDFFHICLEDLKVITIPNCRLQQVSDRVGQYVCTIQAQGHGNQQQVEWQNNYKELF